MKMDETTYLFYDQFRDIVFLAEEYGAIIFVDECHATGFFGKTGR